MNKEIETDRLYDQRMIWEAMVLKPGLPPEDLSVCRIPFRAAVEVSGLAGRDVLAVAVAHPTEEGVDVDFGRVVTADPDPARLIIPLLLAYGVKKCIVDRYTGPWAEGFFRDCGIEPIGIGDRLAAHLWLKSELLRGRVRFPVSGLLKKGLLNSLISMQNEPVIVRRREDDGSGELADAVACAAYEANGARLLLMEDLK